MLKPQCRAVAQPLLEGSSGQSRGVCSEKGEEGLFEKGLLKWLYLLHKILSVFTGKRAVIPSVQRTLKVVTSLF